MEEIIGTIALVIIFFIIGIRIAVLQEDEENKNVRRKNEKR